VEVIGVLVIVVVGYLFLRWVVSALFGGKSAGGSSPSVPSVTPQREMVPSASVPCVVQSDQLSPRVPEPCEVSRKSRKEAW